tara:strand:+ start:35 stop:418 length:384 start_codon:yes stop_codon:yes gene_type:complete
MPLTRVNGGGLADNAVSAAKIAPAAVTAADLADGEVTGAKIEDDVALGGNPTTTTQTAGNNSTRIATTAFVTTAVGAISNSVPVQSTAPTGAVQGDLWWDTDDARLYIYITDTNIVNEAAWVAASPV